MYATSICSYSSFQIHKKSFLMYGFFTKMDIVECNHYNDDMENVLLDDDNLGKCCTECHQHKILNGDLSNGTLVIEEPMFDDSRTDNSEDSPLLASPINDGCFRDYQNAEGEFHCHNSLSCSHEDSKAFKKLLAASFFCFLFMVVELVGGNLAGSLAVMTDAAHLFSDFVGFIISILAIVLARKAATKNMTFGYYRAEVVGAFLSVLTIWFLAIVCLVLALRRLYKEEYDLDSTTMLIVASIGLAVNIIMGGVLHGVCHAHSHGPSIHQDTDNINVRAAAAHVLGDLLQSMGVLIAAILIKIFPEAQAADPICTLIFSVIIIFTTAPVGRDSIWLLMQGGPVSRDKLAVELKKVTGVRHVHDLNVWSLAPGKNVVTAHLAVDEYCDKDTVVQGATASVKSQISIFSCTIQVETYSMDSVTGCKNCKIREC